MSKKGVLFIISGASATGKDTIVSEILKIHADKAVLSISMTTRKPRNGETDGVDYFFVTREKFESNIQNGLMLEYADYGGNYYGTPVEPVRNWLNRGMNVFLVIEVKGASIVRERFPEAKSIFILPPSMNALEKRLRGRGTEDEETIQERLCIAVNEINRAGEYDYIVINDDLGKAVEDVISICSYEAKLKNGEKVSDDETFPACQFKKEKMLNTVCEVINNG